MAEKNDMYLEGENGSVAVDQLLLDAENPRLRDGDPSDGKASQKDLLRRLWEEMSVDEVALSIAANGYYPEERLLVIPARTALNDGGSRYVVIEGNRRLAAVRLLLDTVLRKEIGATDLQDISDEVRATMQILPITIYPDRKRLWALLGFRHINGIKPWDAISKAQYVSDVHERYKVSLEEIARKIGDRHSTVVRLYRGIKILEQAQAQAGFNVDDRASARFAFSHLYTAMDQPGYQKFLGISAEQSLRPNPVGRKKLGELSLLMTWFYGKKSSKTPPVIQSQNPDLNTLREVISKPASLRALRGGMSLEAASQIGIGDQRRFEDSLTRINEDLREAKGTVTNGYKGDESLLQTIEEVLNLASSIQAEMRTIALSNRQKRGGERIEGC